jgi:hypothetical protein
VTDGTATKKSSGTNLEAHGARQNPAAKSGNSVWSVFLFFLFLANVVLQVKLDPLYDKTSDTGLYVLQVKLDSNTLYCKTT